MKKTISTLFALFCLCTVVFATGISSFSYSSASTIYGKVVRLHVLANSDSARDQDIKYLVRDELLKVTNILFKDCKNVSEALGTARKEKALLADTAERVLLQNGCKETVSVVIGKEQYPEKKYASLTFPEGEYLSVRVLIGEGEGKNWWCVLFPPLCNAGVEETGKVMESCGIDKEEIAKLERENDDGAVEIFGCKVKLKILEWFR